MTRPRAAIVSRLDSSTGPGASGHGVRTTAAIAESGRPRCLDRQQRVVDRPQARRGGDDDRQRQLGGEVPDQVSGGERHEQAADPLADKRVGLCGAAVGGGDQPAGSISSPASFAGEVRRGRRSVAIGRDLRVALRRSRPRGAAARGPRHRDDGPISRLYLPKSAIAREIVETGDRGLEDGDPARPLAARTRAITAATTVLPTSVPVPVTKNPRTAQPSRRPGARSEPARRPRRSPARAPPPRPASQPAAARRAGASPSR